MTSIIVNFEKKKCYDRFKYWKSFHLKNCLFSKPGVTMDDLIRLFIRETRCFQTF